MGVENFKGFRFFPRHCYENFLTLRSHLYLLFFIMLFNKMKTTYVGVNSDGLVKILCHTLKDLKRNIKELKSKRQKDGDKTFDDIYSVWVYVYDEDNYDIDFGMDFEMYILDKIKREFIEDNPFEKDIPGIEGMPLDLKELFSLNPTYKIWKKNNEVE